VQTALMNVRFEGDCVAKLDEEQRSDNNRIETNTFLNQYCALPPDLESMLLTWARKIVLQHNQGNNGHDVDVTRCLLMTLSGHGQQLIECAVV
jgi:hypothetical protein